MRVNILAQGDRVTVLDVSVIIRDISGDDATLAIGAIIGAVCGLFYTRITLTVQNSTILSNIVLFFAKPYFSVL